MHMARATAFLAFSALLGLSAAQTPASVLIYSATRVYRHDSIPVAVEAVKSRGSNVNVNFTATEDETFFRDKTLSQYDAVIFLSTSGEALSDDGKAAFQRYLNKGGNFVGLHSATDCMYTTDFYLKTAGAYFDYHPEIQNATVNVLVRDHPSTSMLPPQWRVRDEYYNFRQDPRDVGAVVILSVDESSYRDNGTRQFNQGSPHPTAWYQEHGAGVQPGGTAGRSWYTSLGHLNESWHDDLFMAHVMGGISWALGANTTRAFNTSGMVGGGITSGSVATLSVGGLGIVFMALVAAAPALL